MLATVKSLAEEVLEREGRVLQVYQGCHLRYNISPVMQLAEPGLGGSTGKITGTNVRKFADSPLRGDDEDQKQTLDNVKDNNRILHSIIL
ncbi:hypothetical protein C0Q70_04063 [Pomacea canaliculata]|uniref:Uncharacterized protein n=1 Tax=Pomacea canaliculata TaxID=400727 RepID=A0A2T7PUK1_POMCA|nr:hypothetical protein C0Q70_04063 [Pomacea canaliculata]